MCGAQRSTHSYWRMFPPVVRLLSVSPIHSPCASPFWPLSPIEADGARVLVCPVREFYFKSASTLGVFRLFLKEKLWWRKTHPFIETVLKQSQV